MTARLVVSASRARRLGVRSGGRPLALGSGVASAGGSTVRTFTVRVTRSLRRALSRSKRLEATLEVTVAAPAGTTRRATRRVTIG